MSKIAKTLLGLVGTALVIAVIAIWFLASNLDGIVKRIIEDVGSETVGTQVSLASVQISLRDATGALSGLKVANPADFNEPNAFELGSIAVQIDPTTITGNEVVMPRVIIDQAAVTFEQSGTSNNLQTLSDNMDDIASESSATDEGSAMAEEEMLIVIEELQLNGASMTLVSDQLSEPLSVTLADITVRNIGRRGAGVTPEQAADQIIEPILQKAKKAAKDRIKDELKERAREKVDKEKGKFLDSAKKKLFGN